MDSSYAFVHDFLPLTEADCIEWVNLNLGNGEIGANVDPLGGNGCISIFTQKLNRIGDTPQISAGDAWIDGDEDEIGDFRPMVVRLSTAPVEPSLMEFRKISGYRQELPLKTASCLTSYCTKEGLQFTSENWVSWAEPHLYCNRLKLKSSSGKQCQIDISLDFSPLYNEVDRMWHPSSSKRSFRVFEKDGVVCAIVDGPCNTCGIAFLADPKPDHLVIKRDGAIISYDVQQEIEIRFFFSWMTRKDGDDPFYDALRIVNNASHAGYYLCYQRHLARVQEFWNRWKVSLPDKFTEEIYLKCIYLCASNIGGYFPPSPMPIADATWNGHVFQDYMPCAEALMRSNHTKKTAKTMSYFFDALPAAKVASAYYHCLGAKFPHEMGMAGQGVDKEPYRHIHHKTILVAYIMYQYYTATLDKAFLKEKLFPVMLETSEFLYSFLEKNNFKFAPPSMSIDESAFELNYTNPIDLVAGAKWLFKKTFELAERIGYSSERLRAIAANEQKLVLPQTDFQYLIYDNEDIGDRVVEHPAPFYALWPCPQPIDKEKMINTYYDLVNRMTRDQTWNKWIFVGIARLRRTDLLSAFFDGSSPWSLQQGLDKHIITYYERVSNRRCYMLAPHGFVATIIHEMLMQSWEGIIDVFPCVPSIWEKGEISFHNLVAEGSFLVSSKWKNGYTEWIRIRPSQGRLCRVRCPKRWKKVKVRTKQKEQEIIFKADGDYIEFIIEVGSEYIITESI